MAGNVVIERPDGTSVSGMSEPEVYMLPQSLFKFNSDLREY